MTKSTLTDDQLIDRLDEALRAAKAAPTVHSGAWRPTYGGLGEEGNELFELLIELSSSVKVWQNPGNVPVEPEEREPRQQLGPRNATAIEQATAVFTPVPKSRIGRYLILAHVGSGAMGDVFRAHDPQLDRAVAVKVPRCEKLERSPEMFRERFLREARAAAAVRHAHVCPIYDAGEHEGKPFVVMAFVDGDPLDLLLQNGRIEDIRKSVRIAAEVAEALAEVHRNGIIHRDLKPGNILVDRSGEAQLTDFGLARSLIATEQLTTDGYLIGTPVYMSPEQAAGENSSLTAASDIYSLGAVLYEMLTGTPPFRAPFRDLLQKIVLQTPANPIVHRPDIDRSLDDVVMKSLQKKPEDRYSSADEFAHELRQWLTDNADSVSVEQDKDLMSRGPRSVSRRSQRWSKWSFTLILVSFIAAVVYLLPGFSSSIRTSNSDASEYLLVEPLSPRRQLDVPAVQRDTKPVSPNALRPLTGEINILISSDPERGFVTKHRRNANESQALPVKTGELIQFEVNLNQAAYVYLLWIDPDGSAKPIYPWDAERESGWNSSFLVGGHPRTDRVTCPSKQLDGFETTVPTGMQTVLLLARREPLNDGVDLESLLSSLPAAPDLTFATNDSRPQYRGLKTGQVKSIEHPFFREIDTRLRPNFELVKIVSFPQVD